MPKPPKFHPKHKTTYRVENWPEYEQALRSRGDLTVWLSEDVRAAWVAPLSGKRGAQPIYDEVAIEACLHIGVQRDGLIVAAKLTDSDVRDHEPIPDLLEQSTARSTASPPMVPTTRSPFTLRHETETRAR